MASPLQHTLRVLRAAGYRVHGTEHFNSHIKIRQDYGGFADCIAYKPGVPVLAVNAMHLRHRTEHDKFIDNANLRFWLESGHVFETHEWHKVGPRGQRKLWKVEIKVWSVAFMESLKAQSAGERLTKSGKESRRDGKTHPVKRGRTHSRSARSNRSGSRARVGEANLVGEKHR